MGVSITEHHGEQYGVDFRYAFWVTGRGGHAMLLAIREWCRDRIGSYGYEGKWFDSGTTIFIRSDAHAVEFKLRWL